MNVNEFRHIHSKFAAAKLAACLVRIALPKLSFSPRYLFDRTDNSRNKTSRKWIFEWRNEISRASRINQKRNQTMIFGRSHWNRCTETRIYQASSGLDPLWCILPQDSPLWLALISFDTSPLLMSWLRNGGLDRIRLIDDDSYFASLRLRISITDDGFSRRSSPLFQKE